uniref:Uncharacterized protein n=2 Tax=Opuntia streptacantha TaxID=393608 RepID=A0A7C9CGD7_OPUST
MAATITRAACRLRSPITISPAIYLGRFTRLFSSWPPPSVNPENLSAADDADGGSAAYRNARKYARPPMVTWSERLHNSVSFIGTVKYSPKRSATRNGQFGVYTFLSVKTSPDSHTSFLILLQMWCELAERALQHLKPNDYIYVSGQLGAYTKADLQGIERIKYKVVAKELNYVKQSDPEVNSQRIVKSESEGESPVEKYRSRLLMWQVFFANPSEWHDDRKRKKSPKHPDFRHKSTGEALWLHGSDPPWVKQQLEVLDSKLSERPMDNATSKFLFSRWVPD